MQSAFGNESQNQEKDQLELKKLQEENKRWESDVKSFMERESLKAGLKILEKKKVWLTYKEEVSRYRELQAKAEELNEKYNKASARFKPLEKRIAGKENLILHSQSALRNKVNKFLSASKLCILLAFKNLF